MGVFDFVRNAGAKVGIGKSTDEIAEEEAEKEAAAAAAKASIQKINKARVAEKSKQAQADRAEKKQNATAAKRAAAAEERRSNLKKADALEDYVKHLGLKVSDMDIRYDDGTAFINGVCPSYIDKQKLILAVGNCRGVGEVGEDIEIKRVQQDAPDEEEAAFVTV